MNSFVATSHSNQLILLIFSIIISTCHGWILFRPSTSSSPLSHCANQHQYQHQYLYAKNNGEYDNEEEEEGKPDLFDYFDPLKSPHEYPDGIDSTSSSSSGTATTSSNNNEKETTNNSDDSEKKKYSINVFGMEKHKQQQQHESSSSVASIRNDDDNNNNSPADTDDDLFDYFDPLKSPHEYPNGIDGSNSNTISTEEEESIANASVSSNNNKPFSMNVFGMEYGLQAKPLDVVSEDDENELASQATTKSAVTADNNNNNQDDDLFDYFDPLKSPHEYPNGIGGLNTDDQTNDIDDNDEEEDRYDPLDLRKKRNAIMAKKENDNNDISSSSGSGSKTKVGILLMDHGSRNQDSNKRLQYIADLYQQQMTIMEKSMQGSTVDEDEDVTTATTTTTTVVVRAAHMEIAKPSIQDGIQSLLEENVDEIICHPFFLSPAGRHVKEDIPEIINKAIETLDVKIPIITTEPIGSNIQLMIGAIHASVRENSNLLNI